MARKILLMAAAIMAIVSVGTGGHETKLQRHLDDGSSA